METVIVAILSLIGTLVGTYAGIVSANKVTEWRIKQVESKICTLSKQVEELTATAVSYTHLRAHETSSAHLYGNLYVTNPGWKTSILHYVQNSIQK